MSNPYEPPLSGSGAPIAPGTDREKLRRVAKYQRWVLFSLLANIIGNVVAFATGGQGQTVQLIVLLVVVAIAIFAIVSIFLLAQEIMNAGIGVLCGILMCVPCVSLITLLVVNQKATSYLQGHGVKVGFMGVDPNSI